MQAYWPLHVATCRPTVRLSLDGGRICLSLEGGRVCLSLKGGRVCLSLEGVGSFFEGTAA